jgi:hypothetical protein
MPEGSTESTKEGRYMATDTHATMEETAVFLNYMHNEIRSFLIIV